MKSNLRYSGIILALAAIFIFTAGSGVADVIQDGGDRLVATQNNDGGWDWPLDDGNPNNGYSKLKKFLIQKFESESYVRDGHKFMLFKLH